MEEGDKKSTLKICPLCILSILVAVISLITFYAYVDSLWSLNERGAGVRSPGSINWRLLGYLKIVSLITAPLSLVLAIAHRFRNESLFMRAMALTFSILACLAILIII